MQEVLSGARPELTEVRITYVGANSYQVFAKQLKIMSDLKVSGAFNPTTHTHMHTHTHVCTRTHIHTHTRTPL